MAGFWRAGPEPFLILEEGILLDPVEVALYNIVGYDPGDPSFLVKGTWVVSRWRLGYEEAKRELQKLAPEMGEGGFPAFAWACMLQKSSDRKDALKTFDRLPPIYQYVVLDSLYTLLQDLTSSDFTILLSKPGIDRQKLDELAKERFADEIKIGPYVDLDAVIEFVGEEFHAQPA